MLTRWILLSALIASPAWAKSYSSATTDSTGQHAIGVDLSVSAGGLSIGADYEYALRDNLGIGGYFHYFAKSTSNTRPANGYVMFGPMAAVHYVAGTFDAYAAPGFGFASVDSPNPNTSSALTLGPRIALGILYRINPNLEAGVEENTYWSWFDSDFNGLLINDLSAKIRFSF